MHPIERLRYVARASGTDQGPLVRETAGALTSFADEPQALVVACRRILDRQPTCAALWWLCGRMLTGDDARVEAWRAIEAIERDRTPAAVAAALPDEATVCVLGWPEQAGEAVLRRGDLEVLVVDVLGEGSGLVRRLMASGSDAVDVPQSGLGQAVSASDLVLLEAAALGPGGLLGVAGSLAAASVARQRGIPVWAVAGVGRLVPARVWDAIVGRLGLVHGDAWDADDEPVPLDLIDCIGGPDGPQPVDVALRRVDCPIAPELLGGAARP